MTSLNSIQWSDEKLILLDQTKLPHHTVYVSFDSYVNVIQAIKAMVVRGAPAIALSGAYAVCLAVNKINPAVPRQHVVDQMHKVIDEVKESRPTAVNLSIAMAEMRQVLNNISQNATHQELCAALLSKAHHLFENDIETNKAIARNALDIIPQGANIIHHCNTGSLATADYGTALGAIRYAHEQGRDVHAYLDETRPRLQGASLSSYELRRFGVPHTVIIDSASGYVMRTKKIDLCIVGCDRIASNGDVANKIGTYNLALVARAHNVPFYVACTASSLDNSIESGDQIVIEERSSVEVSSLAGIKIVPDDTPIFNPAFDVTPAELITGFVTERGVLRAPFRESLSALR